MLFKEIEIKGFRNYEHEKAEFHPKVNIIIGKNAQGKTNLLEALYIMSLGKSFRTNKDIEMIGFHKEAAFVKSSIEKEDDNIEVEIILDKKNKIAKIDNVKLDKVSELFNNVYIVVFSPEDLKIVKDEPEKRRRFLNREISLIKPLYYKNLSRYKKTLFQRNSLLKEGNVDENMLYVWNEELATYGSKIIIERNIFLEKLNKISKEIHKNITDNKEELNLSYECNVDFVDFSDSIEEQKSAFMKKLEESKEKDLFRRTTHIGPHRDDVKIEIDKIDCRYFGSQGQQRTAALSLKLAEIRLIKEETEENPILLLDDVLSELDVYRQTFLINSLDKIQTFITTTEVSEYLKDNLNENFIFEVEKGKIKRKQ